jgi:hypothetical protein
MLITLLTIGVVPAFAADVPISEQAARVKSGRKVDVKLSSEETLKGRMGLIAADQFTLEPSDSTKGSARVIRLSEAKTVKAEGLTKGRKWIIFGVAWVVVGVIAKATT